ncbi:MAG TPA: GNAT family N-acetyltransferase, partial [Nannocystis sp.]
MLRLASADDLPALRELERAAGAPFRAIGMATIADDEPPALAVLAGFQRDGRAWVIDDDAGRPVAYLLLEVVDGCAHVEQMSVHPGHARRGLGRELLGAAEGWARAAGSPAITLTTFAGVPWNAPYYARLGFCVIDAGELTPGLRRIRDHEAAR